MKAIFVLFLTSFISLSTLAEKKSGMVCGYGNDPMAASEMLNRRLGSAARINFIAFGESKDLPVGDIISASGASMTRHENGHYYACTVVNIDTTP